MPANPMLDQINESTKVPISHNAPLDCHPDMLLRQNIGAALVDGQGTSAVGYRAGRRALGTLYTALADITDAHSSCHKQVQTGMTQARLAEDGTLVQPIPLYDTAIPEEQKPELAASMTSKFNAVAKTVQINLTAVEESIAEHEQAVTRAARHPRASAAEVIAEAAAIREYVKAMPKIERLGWVEGRIREGDMMVAHAICNAETCWSTGLDKPMHDLMRDAARKQFAPTDYNKVEALKAVRKSITDNTDRFCKRYLELLPMPKKSDTNDKLAKLRSA